MSGYGYYITDVANSIPLYAERFTDAPFVIPAGGGTINVTLSMTVD
jgi:hypothetical protein